MASRKGNTPKQVDHRSAVSGRYVTEKYADSHKSTTVSETRPKPTGKGK